MNEDVLLDVLRSRPVGRRRSDLADANSGDEGEDEERAMDVVAAVWQRQDARASDTARRRPEFVAVPAQVKAAIKAAARSRRRITNAASAQQISPSVRIAEARPQDGATAALVQLWLERLLHSVEEDGRPRVNCQQYAFVQVVAARIQWELFMTGKGGGFVPDDKSGA